MEDQTFNDESFEDMSDTSQEEGYTEKTDSYEEDGSNIDPVISVSKLKEITGREFKDVDDFTKHYKNLSSYVGKKIEQKEVKTEKAMPKDEIIQDLAFKVDHPEYKDHFDIIKMVSKNKGISYSDAISDPIVKEIIEVRTGKKGESILHSNNKISSSSSSLAKLKANVHTEEGLAEYLTALDGE